MIDEKDNVDSLVSFPSKIMYFALSITMIAVISMSFCIYSLYQKSINLSSEVQKVMELRGEILLYDEVLTMSARMASSTGDFSWEERYRKYEILLSKSIEAVHELGDKNNNDKMSAVKIDEANQKMIKMENDAFDLIRSGRKEEAYNVLFSSDYKKQKEIYASGMHEILSVLNKTIFNLQESDRRIATFSIALALFLFFTLSLFWYKAIGSVRSWKGKLMSIQKDLQNAHNHLEDRVNERAAQLHEAFDTLEKEVIEREKIQVELNQAEKMASIGQLAGGIAHEINTPIQYIGDNLKFLKDECPCLINALEEYHKYFLTIGDTVREEEKEILKMRDDLDLDFLKDEIPNSIDQSIEGVGHVAKLVRSMKEFAHPGGDEMKLTDINKVIENVVTVSKNEWKYVADVELKLEENFPEIPCYHGEFNQVILNIVVNASHAIEDDVRGTDRKGMITFFTKIVGENVEICIKDSGCGMPEEVREKVFDPFFTTKGVGKGTGQGLAIAYKLITEKLGGSIKVESKLNEGTSFIVSLPIKGKLDE